MKPNRLSLVTTIALLACLSPSIALAVVTVYFSPDQVATLVNSGVTSDQISCAGYMFTYTRDKLFTGGGSIPIGRPVRVQWPDGIEAQYVTAGPNPGKAQIRVRRVDGGLFDLTAFTAMLLANAGAGRAIEIVPLLNGTEPLNDPLFFDVSGNYGNSFSYDTSPNPLGSTAALVNYDEYAINLTLDYALTALTLTDPSLPVSVESQIAAQDHATLRAAPNPAQGPVRIEWSGDRRVAIGSLDVYSVRGSRVLSLSLGAAGATTWDLNDDRGRPVPAGIYFIGLTSASRHGETRRVVVMR